MSVPYAGSGAGSGARAGAGLAAPPVALIGGRGALPVALVAALEAQGRAVVLCELAGFAFDGLDGRDRIAFRLETLADLFDQLRNRGIGQVCFAGAIRRPGIDPARITPASAALVARLADAMHLGDDGALRAVIALFEDAGLGVLGAADIAPDLLPPAGPLAATPLYPGAAADLAAARAAHADLAARDAGQAVVVWHGSVRATEGPDGTDAMLASLAAPHTDPPNADPPKAGPQTWSISPATKAATAMADRLAARTGPRPTDGGLLYKAAKPGQDRRADLPVIGPGTVLHAADAGLAAIVIEAGSVMVLDRRQVIALADAAGMAVEVRG